MFFHFCDFFFIRSHYACKIFSGFLIVTKEIIVLDKRNQSLSSASKYLEQLQIYDCKTYKNAIYQNESLIRFLNTEDISAIS